MKKRKILAGLLKPLAVAFIIIGSTILLTYTFVKKINPEEFFLQARPFNLATAICLVLAVNCFSGISILEKNPPSLPTSSEKTFIIFKIAVMVLFMSLFLIFTININYNLDSLNYNLYFIIIFAISFGWQIYLLRVWHQALKQIRN